MESIIGLVFVFIEIWHQVLDKCKFESLKPDRTEDTYEHSRLVRAISRSRKYRCRSIERHRYLRECEVSTLRQTKPLLLQGQDNWELITSQQLRRGRRAAYESVNYLTDLHDQVKAHFALDALGIVARPRRNIKEVRALKILNVMSRFIGGGRETDLLWWADAPPLTDNYDTVQTRLKVSKRNSVERDSVPEQRWFLPHSAVLNSNKPGKVMLQRIWLSIILWDDRLLERDA
ncbi:hypothetical protein EVAR_27673_1 [Eumeta japonica]|uniref:Uncharacterized protein n=1 Tax=Eumeta variegata TaxID=151549 RepID=A0A4C1V163_EUMVA|nr:hypothetical protein EVAR_27673_1 [Eumeta japonica]